MDAMDQLALWLAGAPESFGVEQLANRVAEYPQTASALAHLLARIETIEPAEALIEESLAYAALQGGDEHQHWLANRPAIATQPGGKIDFERYGDEIKIRTCRPFAWNAIDRALRDALFEAFSVAAADPEIVAVDWRAEGKAFSTGADLSEFGTTRDPARAHEIRMQTLPAIPLLQCGSKVHVHIHGACIGAGLEMAAFASRISASRNAWFQLPELAMGLIPGAGGCVSVSRRIGIARTALMVISGRKIPARLALEWGLIDAIVEEG
jgi:1,4-dihydroxy-2-naphthoyl-CoA synthase